MEDVMRLVHFLWTLYTVWSFSSFIHPAASSASKTITKKIGSDVTLRCPVSGPDKSHVEWSKNGQRMDRVTNTVWETESQRLTLLDITDDDAGVYRCRLQTNHRQGWDFFLDIVSQEEKSYPSPQIRSGSLVNTTAVEGSTVTMECKVKSRSLYSVHWYRGKHDNLKPNARTQLRKQKHSRKKSWLKREDRLILQNVTLRDTGWHTCMIRSESGLAQHSAWLQVIPSTQRTAAKELVTSESTVSYTAETTVPSSNHSGVDEATISRSEARQMYLTVTVYAVALCSVIVLLGLATFFGLAICKARRRQDVVLEPYNLK